MFRTSFTHDIKLYPNLRTKTPSKQLLYRNVSKFCLKALENVTITLLQRQSVLLFFHLQHRLSCQPLPKLPTFSACLFFTPRCAQVWIIKNKIGDYAWPDSYVNHWFLHLMLIKLLFQIVDRIMFWSSNVTNFVSQLSVPECNTTKLCKQQILD